MFLYKAFNLLACWNGFHEDGNTCMIFYKILTEKGILEVVKREQYKY